MNKIKVLLVALAAGQAQLVLADNYSDVLNKHHLSIPSKEEALEKGKEFLNKAKDKACDMANDVAITVIKRNVVSKRAAIFAQVLEKMARYAGTFCATKYAGDITSDKTTKIFINALTPTLFKAIANEIAEACAKGSLDQELVTNNLVKSLLDTADEVVEKYAEIAAGGLTRGNLIQSKHLVEVGVNKVLSNALGKIVPAAAGNKLSRAELENLKTLSVVLNKLKITTKTEGRKTFSAATETLHKVLAKMLGSTVYDRLGNNVVSRMNIAKHRKNNLEALLRTALGVFVENVALDAAKNNWLPQIN